MVEVFKTNVSDHTKAKSLIELLDRNFPSYKINFDLVDCDKILRVQSCDDAIDVEIIIALLHEHGCQAEVLQDEIFNILI